MHGTVWTGRAVGKVLFAFGRLCTTYRDNPPTPAVTRFAVARLPLPLFSGFPLKSVNP